MPNMFSATRQTCFQQLESNNEDRAYNFIMNCFKMSKILLCVLSGTSNSTKSHKNHKVLKKMSKNDFMETYTYLWFINKTKYKLHV